MQKILLAVIISISMGIFAAAIPRVAYAAASSCPTIPTSSKDQVLIGTGAAGNECNPDAVGNIVGTVVTILSYVAGVAAIVMIILSGFRYITSGGDSARVGSAKNSLIYALIGIAVAVLAQLLVRFVITTSVSVVQCSTGQHVDPADSSKCIKN